MVRMSESRPTNSEVEARRARMDACRETFWTVQGANREHWLQQQQNVPRRLYHYTTLSGVRGITSSSMIWASDVRFMNDASELNYAAKLIDDVIASVGQEVTDEHLRELLPQRPGFANRFHGVQPFVACFCEKKDLLSQWRGYGRGDAPAALGLDLFPLAQFNNLPPWTLLRKVIYDEAEQKRQVADIVRTWLQTVQALLQSDGTDPKEIFPYPAISALQEALLEHQLCFKNPAFSEEHEWRLIKLVNVREELGLLNDRRSDERMAASMAAAREHMRKLGVEIPDRQLPPRQWDAEGIEIKFRESPRGLGLVPYVELPLKDQAGVFTGRLPLCEIVQGPSAHPDLALESPQDVPRKYWV